MTFLYPDYKQAVGELIAEGATPGKIITHDWLDKHLRLNKESKKYGLEKLSAFDSFRKILIMDYRIHLKNIVGKGYVILAPNEQTPVAVSDVSRTIGRAISSGVFRLSNVDTAALSDGEKKENTDALTRIAGLGSMVHRQISE